MSVKSSERVIPGRYALSVGLSEMASPPGWTWFKLTDIARLESGHTPSRAHSDYWDGPIRWVGIVDARDHHGATIHDTAQSITDAGLANSAARLLPPGTVCLVRTAASIGYVTILGREMATSQDLVDWICSERLEPTFLMHLFIAEKESIKSFGKGSAHKTVYFPEVQAFHVCLPPVSEQRRIVTKLEALQSRSRRAKDALDAIPALLERFRQSVLAAAFRGDLTADWRTQHPDVEPASELLKRIRIERRHRWEEAELAKLQAKGKTPGDNQWKEKYEEPERVDASELPELPERWAWASVEELCPAEAPAVYGIIQPGDHVPGGVLYLRPLDIRPDGTINFDSVKRTSQEIASQYSRASLRTGDVVLSIVGTIGKVIVTPSELDQGNITQSSVRLRPPSWMPSDYLRLSLLSPILIHQYDKFRFGNAVQRLNVEHVRRLAVPIAPVAEIAAVLASATRALRRIPEESVAQVTAQLRRLEAGLLAKAFRGELVPQDPNDAPASELLARIAAERDQATPEPPNGPSASNPRAPARKPKKP